MFKKGLFLTLFVFLASEQSGAVPFSAFDTTSFAMGGTGVASARSYNASFYNPALLSAASDEDDFSATAFIGGRYFNEDEFLANAEDFNDAGKIHDFSDAIDDFNAALNAAQANLNFGTARNLLNARNNLVDSGDGLIEGLQSISNRIFEGDGGAGIVLGIPSRDFGMALHVVGYAVGGGIIGLTDEDVDLVQEILDTAASNDPAVLVTLPELVDPEQEYTSSLDGRGLVVVEIGWAISREFDISGHAIAIGITPKYQAVNTYDYSIGVEEEDFEFNFEDGEKTHSSFNVDIGISKSFGDHWRGGFVVRNLVPQEFDTVLDNDVKIEPQARIGAAYRKDWFLVAVDLDLNESDPVGFDSAAQFFGVGVEAEVFKALKLRAGYRHNISDSNTSMLTGGLGLGFGGGKLISH